MDNRRQQDKGISPPQDQIRLNKSEAAAVDYNHRFTYSDFCSKCNAWKGSLGLEPDFKLYINI